MAATVEPISPRRNGLMIAAVEADRAALAARAEVQSRVLAELALHPSLPRGEYDQLCELVIERARTTLEVSVVGIWHFNERDGLLSAHRLLTADGTVLTNIAPLKQSALPKYFSHLGAGEVIDASDAVRDPRTRELAEIYLLPNGISSLLDAPLLIDGRVVGVLCLEQRGPHRAWLPDEIAFARALAQTAAHARLVRRRLRDVAALRASEQRLAAAQSAAKVGIYEWDPQTGAMWWSDQLHRMFGVTPGGFRPTLESFLSLVHGEDRPTLEATLARLLVDPVDATRQLRVVRPDGETRWFDVSWQMGVLAEEGAGKIAGSVLDVSDRQRQQERIHALAFHDPLTHLPNRSLLTQRIDEAIKTAHVPDAQEHTPAEARTDRFAVMFLDIDTFRTVNDSLGHSRGDELLCEIGQRLVRLLDPRATVARLGGDEFILLLPGVTCTEVAERVA
ncbi:MAG: diguanylate cyclase, partial [Lysobacterales bacterium]